MKHPLLKSAGLASLLLSQVPLAAQTMLLDPIGVGANVTVTGSGGPVSSSVELFKNGTSVGYTSTSASGLFSFSNIGTSLNDQFQVGLGQVWNFNVNGNTEGWSVGTDTSLVAGGTWKQTETANGSDMSVNIYGDGLIKTKGRALEIRMRFQGAGSRAASLLMQSAGPNGVAGGGDDVNSAILNTVTLANTADFQTYVFDLGINHAGVSTCWIDGTPAINLNLYIPSTNIGDSIEIDSIRITESMQWNFDAANDRAEWTAAANTTLSNTGTGVLKTTATAANASVSMTRPFRNIGSGYFSKLETRLRQVTTQAPNLIQWNYLSNPAGYGNGGFQLAGTLANGTFETLNIDLTSAPTYGNTWGLGSGATLNVGGNGAFQSLYANAIADYTEIDYIRLHPISRFGPSPVVVASGPPVPPNYYISFSSGSDTANGRTPATAWKTFANINGLTLGAGSTVLLKRGDLWASSKLVLNGKGISGSPITLTAYGDGNRPRITGINLTTESCIVWENPSYVNIDSMDARDAKIGLYLRYTGGNLDGTGAMFNNTNVAISHCYFKNMNEVWSDINGAINVVPPYELSWGTGIWVGGNVPSPPGGPWASDSTPVLNNLSVKFCGFDEVNTGVGMKFYFPPKFYSRFTNFVFEDSWVTGCENGSMALFDVDGGNVSRVDTFLGGTGFYDTGTTSGFIETMKNFVIEDCQFAFSKRSSTSNDGVGFDYEGDTDNVTLRDSVIHDNDGGAFLVSSTNGPHLNFNISNNTMWNNLRNPINAAQNYEMRANPGNTGIYTNNGIYLGATNAIGTPQAHFTSTRWPAYTGGNLNRITTPFSSVSGRPTTWEFTSTVEGWGGINQWTGFGQSGGSLIGTSSGVDPHAESAPTWANTRERRWVYVRMSQTAGTTAQIFFQTEAFPTFTGDKSVAFPIIADGVMRDYVVPMGQSSKYKGVVTKWRLDPTDQSGSAMVIDRFESMLQPYLMSVNQVASNIIDVRFNQAMLPDGGVFNPVNYQLSGLGQGTASANPSTVSLLPGVGEPTYRLTWNSGHTNGLQAILTASNSLDVRGHALWNGSTFAILTQPKPIIDTDMDGMPNTWETLYTLNPNSSTDANLDLDGDGQSNLAEYLANTDPNDSASRFQVIRMEDVIGSPQLLRLVWASASGMAYYVEVSDSLAAGAWSLLTVNPVIANSAETQLDVPRLGGQRFYRIRAFRPNPLIVAP